MSTIYNGVNMDEIEALLLRVHELMCAGGLVRMKYGYDFNGWLPDGRAVRHKFKLDGYERTGPTVAKERAKLGLPTPPTTEELLERLEAQEALSKQCAACVTPIVCNRGARCLRDKASS